MILRTEREVKRVVRQAVRQPEQLQYYNSFAEVSHVYEWADSQKIWIKNGVNWDEYVFHRTGTNAPDQGEWLATGVTTGAAASW